MFTPAFEPALNSNGFCKATFTGAVEVEWKKDVTDADGQTVRKTGTFTKLNFEIMGRVRGKDKIVSLTDPEGYSQDSPVGIVLGRMGFVPPVLETTVDDFGFEVVKVNEDEDGFDVSEGTNVIGEAIVEFCKDTVGTTYMVKLEKPTTGRQKGYFQLIPSTLTPLVVKAK